MLAPKRKSNKKQTIIFVVLAVLSVLFVLGSIKEVLSRYQVEKQIKDLEQEISDLEEENRQIGDDLSSWSSSNQLEKEARLKLGLQKPGEKVVVVLRDEEKADDYAESGDTEIDYQKKGNSVVATRKTEFNPWNWWQYFFN